MKPTKPNLNQSLSKRVRRSRRVNGPAGRAQADLDAMLDAYLEAGHLSASDLIGEITMLRSVLRRVFTLASQESDLLEERELEQVDGEGEERESTKDTEKAVKGRSKKKAAEPEKWVQQPLLSLPDTKKPGEEPTLNSLELWVQTLESLSRGALRLANLMRTHQVLNKGKAEPEETGKDEPEEIVKEKPEEKGKDVLKNLSTLVDHINTNIKQEQEKGK